MLRIGLLGFGTDQLASLQKAPLRADVQWSVYPADEKEQAGFDLLLAFATNVDAAQNLARRSRVSPLPVPLAYWPIVPAAEDVDAALQVSLEETYGFVVGYYPAVHLACRWIRAVAHQVSAALDLRTLIVGETGVGKELVAKAIHRLGPRRKDPLVNLNCGGLPAGLISSELFGHKRGAFSGAVADRQGAFYAAGKGILFLDEVGELPLELQTHLLRVLEHRAYSPVGSDQTLVMEAQVISATNRPLHERVNEGTFRADLFYRLAQVRIWLPPLRERMDDLPLLTAAFLRRHGMALHDLQADVLSQMSAYSWPGNIRELHTVVDRLVLSARSGQPPGITDFLERPGAPATAASPVGTLAQLRHDFERQVLEAVLARCGGDTDRAAKELGVTRRSIYNLLRRHALPPK
jgi:transcriptional regulator with GAF, ATPase, and Fis domain